MVVQVSTQTDYKAMLCQKYNAMFEDRTAGLDRLEYVMAVLGPETKSILLRHEACYVLGQMKDKRAVPLLTQVLNDESEHEITRHEAAEALGAIGDDGAMLCLCQYTASESVPLKETCELGVDRLQNASVESGDFNTIDPVALERGSVQATEADIDDLLDKLLDPSTQLTDKYKCLFSLRTITDAEHKPSIKAIIALGRALRDESTSALLRHEIGFVIGQLAFGVCASLIPSCIDSLQKSVCDQSEHCMVRHEAAIALGSIAGKNETIEDFLTKYAQLPIDEANQDEAIVIESCVVATESLRYWRNHSFSIMGVGPVPEESSPLTEKMLEIQQHFEGIRDELEQLPSIPIDAMTYSEMKMQLMINYVTNLAFYLSLKRLGETSVGDHPVFKHLAYLRTFMERLAPLDAALKYQIDRLLMQEEVEESGAAPPTGAGPNLTAFIPVKTAVKGISVEQVKKAYAGAPVGDGPMEIDPSLIAARIAKLQKSGGNKKKKTKTTKHSDDEDDESYSEQDDDIKPKKKSRKNKRVDTDDESIDSEDI